MRKLLVIMALAAVVVPATASAAKPADKWDADGNGIADVGVVVNRHWTSLYAYDAGGDYYWDLGDGRIYKTVPSVADLDQSTLTVCDYVNNSRGTFENTPYQDTGWIQNQINCKGAEAGHWTYLIVHRTDPRYTGDPDRAIWGTWEYKVLTGTGYGNWFRATG